MNYYERSECPSFRKGIRGNLSFRRTPLSEANCFRSQIDEGVLALLYGSRHCHRPIASSIPPSSSSGTMPEPEIVNEQKWHNKKGKCRRGIFGEFVEENMKILIWQLPSFNEFCSDSPSIGGVSVE